MLTISQLKEFQSMELIKVKREIYIEMEEFLEYQRRVLEQFKETQKIKLESLQLRFEKELRSLNQSKQCVEDNNFSLDNREKPLKANEREIVNVNKTKKKEINESTKQIESVMCSSKLPENPESDRICQSFTLNDKKRRVSLDKNDEIDQANKKQKVDNAWIQQVNMMRLNHLRVKKDLSKKLKISNRMHENKESTAKDEKLFSKSVFCSKENKIIVKEIKICNKGQMIQISNKI
ncbi:unnamed protein product [Brachionus calyciflorus]|uniref:Uncharacterized protein n=1 Tax=Brachionus calyciflorus TaxID=104777 RepID=A0A814MN59_9BILA|nr:unnamed protein product [Brachionus calyciflorus]